MNLHRTTRIFAVLTLAATATTARAQHAPSTDAALALRVRQTADSIYSRTRSPVIRQRYIPRLRAAADTIVANPLQHDTLYVTRVETLYVQRPDTTTRPDTGPVVITPGGSSLFAPHPFPPLSNGALFAELPRDSVPITIPAPTRTIVVSSLRQAYDTARTGDRLLIPRNHTTDIVHLGPTSRTGWVTIQGTDSTSVITTTVGGAESAVHFDPGAHHIRLLGPLTIRASTNATNALLRSYNGETRPEQMVHDVIVDGVTIDMGQYEGRRCAWPDGIRIAIVRSRLLNCASRSGDAQAILVGNGPGPYRFQGNWLEGGHQCFMSGGFDPTYVGNIPSDVYFADNTCYKRPEWHFTLNADGSKNYSGVRRQVKTILETKFIRRLLAERNLFWGVWADAQAGFGGLLKSENQDGGNPTAQTVDVTLRYNRFRAIANGINIAAHPGSYPSVSATRITVYGNVFENLSTLGGEGKPIQLLDNLVDVALLNNTFSNATNDAVSFDGGPGVRTTLMRNVIPNGAYGVKGSGTASGNDSWTRFTTNGLFLNNVIVGGDCTTMPATTTCTLPAPAGVGADTTKVPK